MASSLPWPPPPDLATSFIISNLGAKWPAEAKPRIWSGEEGNNQYRGLLYDIKSHAELATVIAHEEIGDFENWMKSMDFDFRKLQKVIQLYASTVLLKRSSSCFTVIFGTSVFNYAAYFLMQALEMKEGPWFSSCLPFLLCFWYFLNQDCDTSISKGDKRN
ncbi:hypothetical protein PTKIN_Ptkin08bG0108400 [Pterospermum kingtungense]